MVKCPECNKNVDRNIEPFVTHSKRHYHETCYQQFQLRGQHRSDLINYICELYRIQTPNGFMLKQIKEFQDDYGYTLKGMELALRYFHDIEGNSVDAKGIGIVPYIYEDARNYYIRMNNVKKHSQNVVELQNKEVEVVKFSNTNKRKPKIIDIGGL